MIKKKYFILWLGKWKLSLINIKVGELNEVETTQNFKFKYRG